MCLLPQWNKCFHSRALECVCKLQRQSLAEGHTGTKPVQQWSVVIVFACWPMHAYTDFHSDTQAHLPEAATRVSLLSVRSVPTLKAAEPSWCLCFCLAIMTDWPSRPEDRQRDGSLIRVGGEWPCSHLRPSPSWTRQIS